MIGVTNHGSPLDPEDLASLFDPYRRTKSAIEGHQQGWGLGLPLVRGVVEAHGGTVEVRSGPLELAGFGTTFTLEPSMDTRPYLNRMSSRIRETKELQGVPIVENGTPGPNDEPQGSRLVRSSSIQNGEQYA